MIQQLTARTSVAKNGATGWAQAITVARSTVGRVEDGVRDATGRRRRNSRLQTFSAGSDMTLAMKRDDISEGRLANEVVPLNDRVDLVSH